MVSFNLMVIMERLPSDKTCPVFRCVCSKCGVEMERTGHRKSVEQGASCRSCYLAQAEEKRFQLVCVIADATEVIGRPPTYAELAARCVCSRTHIWSEVKKLQAEFLVDKPERLVDPVTGFGFNQPGVKLTAAGRLIAARSSRVTESA